MKKRKKIHDDWVTPKELVDYISMKYFDGDLPNDPCPLHYINDGLVIDWDDPCFVNPPYEKKMKEAFINKAFEESKKGIRIVMILPVSTSTKIFHDVILPNCDIEFLRGRVKFGGYNSNGVYVKDRCGQHDTMLVKFKEGKQP